MAISLPLAAQLTYTRISTATVYTCPCPLPGQVVHVPVTVKNFKPISSVSFKIRFANANLEWAGYQDLHPDLPPSLVYHSTGMSYNDINIVAYRATGCYEFPFLDNDTYSLNIVSSLPWIAGAVNATDALLVMRGEVDGSFLP